MRRIFIYSLLALLLLGLNSCQKEDDTTPTNNYNNDEPNTTFVVPEIKDVVLYEVNLRAFSSSGNLQGVKNRLDQIEDLGVNVIWLMPIYPIGELNSVNSPYCVKDYTDVNPEFGTFDDLTDFVDEAHSRNIAVILDWVANHTSWDNAWIENEDWYTQDGSGNIIHPPGTNWEDVADLNYDNYEMRAAMISAMKFWVNEANIDGFRCDYADGVPYDFWESAWTSLDSIQNRDFIFFAEGSRADHFDAGFDLNFGWEYYGAIKSVYNGQSVDNIFTAHENEYNTAPTGKHWVRFTTNHDESAWDATPISLFNGIDGALAASAVTVFSGGVPLIYGSQEVGTADNVPFFYNSTIYWNNNPAMLEAYETMLQFYSGSQVAKEGQITVFQDDDVVCFKKSMDGDDVVIMVNLRNSNIIFSVPSALDNTNWIDIMTQNNVTLSGQVSLSPYQFYILEQ